MGTCDLCVSGPHGPEEERGEAAVEQRLVFCHRAPVLLLQELHQGLVVFLHSPAINQTTKPTKRVSARVCVRACVYVHVCACVCARVCVCAHALVGV